MNPAATDPPALSSVAPVPDASVGDPDFLELTAELMRAARSLTDRLVATEDNGEASALGHTLARVARAVRQTKLLAAKLADGSALRERAARDGGPAPDGEADGEGGEGPPSPEARIISVREQISLAIDQLPPAEAAEAWERLDVALDEERAAPERAVIESVLRVARRLGVRKQVSLIYSDKWEPRDRRTDIHRGERRWRQNRRPP